MKRTTERAASYALGEIDLPRLSDEEVRPLARLYQVLSRERSPEDPVTALDVLAQRLRARPDVAETRDWMVRHGDDVVGLGTVTRWKVAENPHWRDAWIAVHPAHRRRGLARRLLREIVAAAGGSDEVVLGSWTTDRVPAGDAFARGTGATEGLTNRTSQLVLAEVDRALVAEWAALDPAGYRLVWIEDDVPEELTANVVAAYETMNTAPRGDLRTGDWRVTPAEIRDWDRTRRKAGAVRRLLLAVHEATGETAGFTEVTRNPGTPWFVGQQGTAVVPAHRGHGIGKWIKAVVVRRILEEWPEARLIRTGNAYSNAPMLSINDRLGFKVAWSMIVWQLAIADARAYLAGARPS
ncbi:MAG TPA: GNAT family N-acetyltransferase [Candidatus Limnocylindrales bacterium]|nr:GNAT family N-acetyltransferase [Candidatus Limnocylindrales bacterium]